MAAANFITEQIQQSDQTIDFDSGTPALDQYLARHAYSNDLRGIGRTFVLRNPERGADSATLIGFYTLSMATLEVRQLPKAVSRNLPKYPLPVALIARLAVDKRNQGRGFGEKLLTEALHRILLAADTVGCFGVVVDAKDDRAVTFYEKYAFTVIDPTGTFPRRMFLAISTARAARSCSMRFPARWLGIRSSSRSGGPLQTR